MLTARLDGAKPSPWSHPADLLIELLTREAAFADAWAALRKHGASARTEEALARASEAIHPREAVDAYAKRVEQLVTSGGNTAYEDAAGLVARMAALRSRSEQAAYLTALKGRHARKRNLMRLL